MLRSPVPLPPAGGVRGGVWVGMGFELGDAHPAATSERARKSRFPPACGRELLAQFFYLQLDRSRDRFGVVHYVVIDEVQDDVAARFQVGVAADVAFRCDVVAVAVDFDHQRQLAT